MTAYYLSGPMRNKPDFNRKEFHAVERDLSTYIDSLGNSDGTVITNPARNFNGETGLPTTAYMTLDIQQVCQADVVVLIDGWQMSEGAIREANVGIWTGKRFMRAILDSTTGTYVFEDLDAPEFTSPSPRGGVLDEAKHLVTGDRNSVYGPPDQDFSRTAAMATGFGFTVAGKPLEGHHVAIFLILLKMSRLAWTPTKRDSWVDTAGYAACGFETATLSEDRKRADAARTQSFTNQRETEERRLAA